jgi:hypothetical protein
LKQSKKAKVGRPKMPKGEAKGRIVLVRFTHDDLKAIAKAAKANKQTVSEWIRSTVMGRNVKRWYAYCPDELHITLFENQPRPKDLCTGCGRVLELHGACEGYVSYDEAAKGRADSRPPEQAECHPPSDTAMTDFKLGHYQNSN